MKIGVTERGDAGLNSLWHKKLAAGGYDGAVLITKNANEDFRKRVMELHSFFPNVIVHICCTGFGGTMMEPNIPEFHEQLEAIPAFTSAGFPHENIVVRVDPIVPTCKGLQRVRNVLDSFLLMETSITRVRFSLFDEYEHVRWRLLDAGARSIYNGFSPTVDMMDDVIDVLRIYPMLDFETCAEDDFVRRAHAAGVTNVEIRGCVSDKDLAIFGLKVPAGMGENKQQRHGCHCLSCKTELLASKHRCAHKCLYCYWRD